MRETRDESRRRVSPLGGAGTTRKCSHQSSPSRSSDPLVGSSGNNRVAVGSTSAYEEPLSIPIEEVWIPVPRPGQLLYAYRGRSTGVTNSRKLAEEETAGVPGAEIAAVKEVWLGQQFLAHGALDEEEARWFVLQRDNDNTSRATRVLESRYLTHIPSPFTT